MMKDVIRFLWVGLDAVLLVWFFLLVVWLLIPFFNGYLIPDDYNAAFYPVGTSDVITRIVLYGLGLLEWMAFVALLFLVNRLIFRNQFVAREKILMVGGLCGACILVLLALVAK
jgi:hypothetical protein